MGPGAVRKRLCLPCLWISENMEMAGHESCGMDRSKSNRMDKPTNRVCSGPCLYGALSCWRLSLFVFIPLVHLGAFFCRLHRKNEKPNNYLLSELPSNNACLFRYHFRNPVSNMFFSGYPGYPLSVRCSMGNHLRGDAHLLRITFWTHPTFSRLVSPFVWFLFHQVLSKSPQLSSPLPFWLLSRKPSNRSEFGG